MRGGWSVTAVAATVLGVGLSRGLRDRARGPERDGPAGHRAGPSTSSRPT